MAQEKTKRFKKEGFTFEKAGINVGEELTFIRDGIVVKVAENNKIEYEGKIYSLSAFGKEKLGYLIAGTHCFKYNGTLLCNL